MSDVIKIYKIRNKKTGLYRTASGGFGKSGKTWNNIGHLKSSIAQEGWYSFRGMSDQLPHNDLEIVEIEVRQDENNTRPLRDLVTDERRKRELVKKYGSDFVTLIERIEAAGQNDDFQWVLIVDGTFDWKTGKYVGDLQEMLDTIKGLKYKQNKDYKKATSANGGAFAFSSKMLAMTVRLAIKGKVQGVDIVKYIETDLDSEETSTV